MSDLHNPYAPPKTSEGPLAVSAEDLIDASQGQRFANLLIDEVMVVVGASILLVPATIANGGAAPLGGRLIGIATLLAYYILCEAIFGRTLGKLITGTRVVTLDGGKPGFAKILGRSVARLVPFEPFSFLAGPNGWHDRWSGTRVVRVRR
jgi:uncharacterized RDD family membrane protein YckC